MIIILGVSIWSCLCWMVVLFCGFCCSFWILGEWGEYGLLFDCLVGRAFCVPARCFPWGSQVEHVSRSWELAWNNVEGLEECEVRGSNGGVKAESLKKLCRVPREKRQRARRCPSRWSDSGLGMRLGNWKWGLGRRVGKCLSDSPVFCLVGSQVKMFLRVLVADTKGCVEGEGRIRSPVELPGNGREKERS